MSPILKITPLGKRLSLYSDFHKDLTINPISKDIALKLDEDAIKESMKNLILTERGERLFQPTLGSNVRKTLFENNTPATLKILQEQVKEVINNFEPRITLIDVEIINNYDSNKVGINIIYYIRNSETPISTTIFLERAR
jgi:uncharacterized protein